jgi:hypothetical protein
MSHNSTARRELLARQGPTPRPNEQSTRSSRAEGEVEEDDDVANQFAGIVTTPAVVEEKSTATSTPAQGRTKKGGGQSSDAPTHAGEISDDTTTDEEGQDPQSGGGVNSSKSRGKKGKRPTAKERVRLMASTAATKRRRANREKKRQALGRTQQNPNNRETFQTKTVLSASDRAFYSWKHPKDRDPTDFDVLVNRFSSQSRSYPKEFHFRNDPFQWNGGSMRRGL